MTLLPLKKMEVCQAALRHRTWDTLQYTEPFPRGDPGYVFSRVGKYRTPIAIGERQSKQNTGISFCGDKKNVEKKGKEKNMPEKLKAN